MQLSSRFVILICLGAPPIAACGSADSSSLTGGGSSLSGGSASGPGAGGFSFVGSGGAPFANGGVNPGASGVAGVGGMNGTSGAPSAGGAGGASGASNAGGASQGEGGMNRGGVTASAGGVSSGASGGRPAEGGAGSTLASLPTGGIVTTDCAACAKTHCPNELTACDADAACRTAEACMTTCSLVDCASCIFGAPPTFKQLFSDCLKSSCPTVCPGITTG